MMRHHILSYRTHKTICRQPGWPYIHLEILDGVTSVAAVSFQLRVRQHTRVGVSTRKTMSSFKRKYRSPGKSPGFEPGEHWQQLQAAWVNALVTPVLSGSVVASVTF